MLMPLFSLQDHSNFGPVLLAYDATLDQNDTRRVLEEKERNVWDAALSFVDMTRNNMKKGNFQRELFLGLPWFGQGDDEDEELLANANLLDVTFDGCSFTVRRHNKFCLQRVSKKHATQNPIAFIFQRFYFIFRTIRTWKDSFLV
jgi:hypothetical protein